MLKNTNIILAALAVLALASCAKVENSVPEEQAWTQKLEVPLGFGIYLPQTKAGASGSMTNEKLQGTGFGVFAYVKAGDYDGSTTPNFMYNQEVTYSASEWTYSPVKYWPNQLSNAGAQKVSFFAYAPFVESAGGSEGITAMSDVNTPGDPTLTYKVSGNLDQNVDLVWGTSNGATWTNVIGGDNTVLEGFPYLNLQKPSVGTRVSFRFYHALAQLNLSAVGSFNILGAGGTPADGVKITISNVELLVEDQYDGGVLHLKNEIAKTPQWDLSHAGETDLTLVVGADDLHADIKDLGAVEAANQPIGVTAEPRPVLKEDRYFTLIPRGTAATVTVKVHYFVTTDDPSLHDGYTRVENVIKNTITFPNGFKAGTISNIKMILGLTGIALSGEVTDWETGQTIEVDLPKNEN